ncbi:hypothetical protein GCM10009077_15170 [Roseibium denhamense]
MFLIAPSLGAVKYTLFGALAKNRESNVGEAAFAVVLRLRVITGRAARIKVFLPCVQSAPSSGEAAMTAHEPERRAA